MRAVAAATNIVYVSHTMVEYLALIDRTSHLVHVAVVAVVIPDGHPVPDDIPFSEALSDAHDELQSTFDVHVALLHWNVVHPRVAGVALNAAQVLKIVNNLATLMKDCNAHLAVALCQVLHTVYSGPFTSRRGYATTASQSMTCC